MRAEDRVAAVDVIKAAAIIAVIVRHAGPPSYHPAHTDFDHLFRSSWVMFHVPSFLVVAGFLMARERLSSAEAMTRLRRILVPYLIASLTVQLIGYAGARGDWERMLFKLATASSFGIYYFVFVYVACTLLMVPLSRLRPPVLLGLLVLLYLYGELARFFPEYRILHGKFWSMRDPTNFFLAYFLTGWLARLHWTKAKPFLEARGVGWHALCGLLIVGVIAINAYGPGGPIRGALRPIYTLAVIGLIASIDWRQPLSKTVLWLSECTLGIFLFHSIFIRALTPATIGWPPALRTAALMAAALAGCLAIAWLGRRLLGAERARSLLGF